MIICTMLLLAIPLAILWSPVKINYQTNTIGLKEEASRETNILPCHTITEPHEPPCNPSLARSPWAISHGSSYAQGSSTYPAPDGTKAIVAQHLDLGGIPITLNFSAPYSDGNSVIWSVPLLRAGRVAKIDHRTFQMIDFYDPQQREEESVDYPASISGAYSAIDADNRFIIGRSRFIEIFSDAQPNSRFSSIALQQRLTLPDTFFCSNTDTIVGLGLTYDDHIVFATEQAVVGILPRQQRLSSNQLQRIVLSPTQCEAPNEISETISNNIAIDEEGGIFVVTSKATVRVQWSEGILSTAWRTPYKSSDTALSALRLGPGSGSTPSLMGTGQESEKFVVITDGQPLMHLLLLWRDQIPSDWEALAPDLDRRIACQIPVRFGDPEATSSLSEQSVLVHNYATIIVNNQLKQEQAYWQLFPAFIRTSFAAGRGGWPDVAPYGIERIDWNPETRTCATKWVNKSLSIPNGIPTMSTATGLFYGIGQRDGVWGLEAVNFATGESRFFVESRQTHCSWQAVRLVEPRAARLLAALRLSQNPRVCENAFFAATEIGPDSTIYTGTFMGISRFVPSDG